MAKLGEQVKKKPSQASGMGKLGVQVGEKKAKALRGEEKKEIEKTSKKLKGKSYADYAAAYKKIPSWQKRYFQDPQKILQERKQAGKERAAKLEQERKQASEKAKEIEKEYEKRRQKLYENYYKARRSGAEPSREKLQEEIAELKEEYRPKEKAYKEKAQAIEKAQKEMRQGKKIYDPSSVKEFAQKKFEAELGQEEKSYSRQEQLAEQEVRRSKIKKDIGQEKFQKLKKGEQVKFTEEEAEELSPVTKRTLQLEKTEGKGKQKTGLPAGTYVSPGGRKMSIGKEAGLEKVKEEGGKYVGEEQVYSAKEEPKAFREFEETLAKTRQGQEKVEKDKGIFQKGKTLLTEFSRKYLPGAEKVEKFGEKKGPIEKGVEKVFKAFDAEEFGEKRILPKEVQRGVTEGVRVVPKEVAKGAQKAYVFSRTSGALGVSKKRAKFESEIIRGLVPETTTEISRDVATYGVAKGAGFLLRGAGKVISKTPKVGGVLGVGYKATTAAGGLGATGLYGYSKVKEFGEVPKEEKGEFIGETAKETIIFGTGFSKGMKGVDVFGGKLATRGRQKISIERLTPKEVATGQKTFPEAPPRKQFSIFQRTGGKYPELGGKGAFHATGGKFWKKGQLTPGEGTSELPGLYGSAYVSPYFTQVKGKTAESVFKFPKLGSIVQPETKPGIAYLKPKGFRKGEWGGIARKPQVQKGQRVKDYSYFKKPAKEGTAEVPGMKREIEAVFRPEAGKYKFEAGKYYTEIDGVPVPIDTFRFQPGTGTTAAGVAPKTKTVLGTSKEYSLPSPSAYRTTFKGAPTSYQPSGKKSQISQSFPKYKKSAVQSSIKGYKTSYRPSDVGYKPSGISYKPSGSISPPSRPPSRPPSKPPISPPSKRPPVSPPSRPPSRPPISPPKTPPKRPSFELKPKRPTKKRRQRPRFMPGVKRRPSLVAIGQEIRSPTRGRAERTGLTIRPILTNKKKKKRNMWLIQ